VLDYSPGQDIFHLSHHVALHVLINNASPLFPFPQLSLPFFPDTEDHVLSRLAPQVYSSVVQARLGLQTLALARLSTAQASQN